MAVESTLTLEHEPTGANPESVRPRAPERLLDIDRAKGLGIALVVWGHLAGQSAVPMPTWFYISVGTIYEFHMPFFMYLSGFVYFLMNMPERFARSPGSFVAKRFDRLVIPMFAISLIIVLGKHIAASWGPMDDPVGGIGAGLLNVLTNAPDNPALSVWYLLVLFAYSVLTPPIWFATCRRMAVLLVLALAAWLLPLPETFYLHRLAVYFVFFVAGGLVAQHRDRVLPVFARLWPVALVGLGALCWLLEGSPYALLLCGLASVPALHGLMLWAPLQRDRILLLLGRYSMVIYLLNTIVIGIGKALWERSLPQVGGWAVAFLLVTFFAGLVVPMLVRCVLDAIPPLRPVSRYLD